VNQAPPAVTQTINRVVERTIEKIVPATSQGAAVVTKETVVVKQEDLTIQAVEKNSKGIVRIFGQPIAPQGVPENSGIISAQEIPANIFVGVGAVISKDGVVIIDRKALSKASALVGVFAGGKSAPLKFLGVDNNGQVAVLQIDKGDSVLSAELPQFIPVVLGDSDSLKLGQSLIAVGGQDRNNVALGIASSLITKDEAPAPTANQILAKDVVAHVVSIETDISSRGVASGGVLLNLSGEVVGLNLGDGIGSTGGSVYTAINLAKKQADSVLSGLNAKTR
jgi:S1-C subfamily serine protease